MVNDFQTDYAGSIPVARSISRLPGRIPVYWRVSFDNDTARTDPAQGVWVHINRLTPHGHYEQSDVLALADLLADAPGPPLGRLRRDQY